MLHKHIMWTNCASNSYSLNWQQAEEEEDKQKIAVRLRNEFNFLESEIRAWKLIWVLLEKSHKPAHLLTDSLCFYLSDPEMEKNFRGHFLSNLAPLRVLCQSF